MAGHIKHIIMWYYIINTVPDITNCILNELNGVQANLATNLVI